MYDRAHQLCNAIQAMNIYNLFHSLSPTLFNQKLFLQLLLSPNSFIFCWSVLQFPPHRYVMLLRSNSRRINAAGGCHGCLSAWAGHP